MNRKISIIVPVHNEEVNVPLLYTALRAVFEKIPAYTREIIFVDDGSTDKSALAIRKIIESDPSVVCVAFTRNFGKEMAMTAGIRTSTGDAVIMIDADLQHPPALIPEFISRWENGAEVVVGVRANNKSYSMVKKCGTALYYALMKMTSETEIISRETDYRLIDRAVVDVFNTITERQRNTRALINWLGFKRECIGFEINERKNGKASYSFKKLFHLAIYSFVSHSLFPLRLAGYVGVGITFFSGLLGAAVFIERYIFNDSLGWYISGSAQLSIINAFLIGIVLMCLGLIALYIGNIQSEVTNRPMYIIKKERRGQD